MSYASRVYRQRNPRSDEKSGKDSFFSKQDDTQKGSRPGAFFQTKLEVNKPGDKYEQEADAVANRVVNQSSRNQVVQQKDISAVQRAMVGDEKEKPKGSALPEKKEEDVQRMATPEMKEEEKKKPEKKVQKQDEPEKEEEDTIQAKRESTDQANAAGLSRLENSSDKGAKLSSSVLKEMNTSFGTDFSDVRIHDNKESAKMNNAIQAQAFTHGKDIYFNDGKYNPQSSSGKKLLAHELTHTIQQTGKSTLPNSPSSVQQKDAREDRTLRSSRFAGDEKLEEALDDVRHVKYGANGEHVVKLQQAMIDVGIPMPVSTRKTGSPDGIFLEETHQSVRTFQRKCGLEGTDVDGIVGPITMGLFDARFAGEPNVKLPTKKKRITLNITYLHGTSVNPSHALAYANTIYNHQANIEIVRGKEVRLNQKETEAVIGNDLMLEEHFFDQVASDEEKLLFKINQSADAISAYFVKEISDIDGSVSQHAVAYAITQQNKMGIIGIALGNRSKYQTLAHEIGHVLGVQIHSMGDESLLMGVGAPGYRLSAEHIKTMRSSPFAKDV